MTVHTRVAVQTLNPHGNDTSSGLDQHIDLNIYRYVKIDSHFENIKNLRII